MGDVGDYWRDHRRYKESMPERTTCLDWCCTHPEANGGNPRKTARYSHSGKSIYCYECRTRFFVDGSGRVLERDK